MGVYNPAVPIQPCMEAQALFGASLPLVERIARDLCRRSGIHGADAEDFAAAAKLALVEDDYAVLRTFEGRSSLATYLTVVLSRLLADQQMRTLGRFRPSAEAARMGPAAVRLEALLLRDGRSLDEALPFVRALDPALTRERAEALARSLPPRDPRPRVVAIPDLDAGAAATPALAAPERADARAIAAEARRLATATSRVVRQALDSFPLEDRVILRLRFGSSASLADVSRMLRLPQRPLYRRVEALLARLRAALEAAGLDAGGVAELIGGAAGDMDFGLAERENGAERQTLPKEEEAGEMDLAARGTQ